MSILLAALVATSALTATAHAAEAPVIAPPPAWVNPISLPPATEKSDDTPIRIILSDQQIAFEQGRKTVYTETILRIQTPQGLSAGNISLPWRPETDLAKSGGASSGTSPAKSTNTSALKSQPQPP